jgi:hypothetical protein
VVVEEDEFGYARVVDERERYLSEMRRRQERERKL